MVEEAERLWKKKRLKKDDKSEIDKQIQKYRRKVKKMGIIKWIQQLPCPPFSKDKISGLTPEHIILEPFQIEFILAALEDDTILSAARGAGKTFIWALVCLYELVIYDYYSTAYLGGSIKQSRLAQKYIDFFRRKVPELRYIMPKSLHGLQPRIETIFNSEINFMACSLTAVSGPRSDRLVIDEVCTASEKGKIGREAIEAALEETIGRRDSKIGLTSTTRFLGGKFYEILSEPERYGFKRFIWSIARHISGRPVEQVFMDRNPKNWFSAVWWVTDRQIRRGRKNSTDARFLVKYLGLVSLASGFVIAPDDLGWAVCNQCDECRPFEWGHCKLIEQYKLGTEKNPLKYLRDISAGFDYGAGTAPSALVVGGLKGRLVFIIFADEYIGERITVLSAKIIRLLRKYNVVDFLPDPASQGLYVSESIENAGYNRIYLDSNLKPERIQIVQNIFEKKKIIIPKAFWKLIKSLQQVQWKKGKIDKQSNDHSWDALCFLCAEWGEGTGYELDPELTKGLTFEWDQEKKKKMSLFNP